MNEIENFKFELVEEIATPCISCAWSASVAAGVVAAT